MNLQYAAGFVDGEGCIGFARCRKSIFPRIIVTNTNIDILNEFKQKWGGNKVIVGDYLGLKQLIF